MTTPVETCSVDVENVFGPIVDASCLDGFDFTLLFEELIFTALPLGLAILWCAISTPRNGPVKVQKSWSLTLKMLAYGIYIGLQVALLVTWTRSTAPVTSATLAVAGLTVAGYVGFMLVSCLEHLLSVRPSTPLSVFLGASLLLDIARTRTLFYVPANQLQAKLNLISFVAKIIVFSLELVEKRRRFKPAWYSESPEASANVYNRTLLLWLNRLFVTGFRSPLTLKSLMPIDPEILDSSCPISISDRWKKANTTRPYALLVVFISHYRYTLLLGVIPRLVSLGLSFAQPILIESVLEYTESGSRRSDVGYGLIVAYALVYIGLALSSALYQHQTNRAMTMFRGSLVTLVYNKTTQLSSSALSEAEAITLMSADIDRIDGSFHFIHESYSCLIEIALALWFLYYYLGVAMAAPTVFVVLITALGIPIATMAGNAQVQWLEAIEVRLEATSNWLQQFKSLRLAGLVEHSSSVLTRTRKTEIASSQRYRICMIALNLGTTVTSTVAPLLGFGFYLLVARAGTGETLTPGVAFATLSVLQLLIQPANTFVDAFEHIQTLYRCFERIQEYLLVEDGEEIGLPSRVKFSSQRTEYNIKMPAAEVDAQYDSSPNNVIVSLDDVSVSLADDHLILRNLSTSFLEGGINVIVGPVGSGKSTLLKLIVGEAPKVHGSIYRSFSTAAFCSQPPWITSASIRDNILGSSHMTEGWYNEVVEACALISDFKELSEGDGTQAGTKGAKLSGGQQARVSLARALYSRKPILILDDVLAGLDSVTERSILDSVFGPKGIVRKLKASVILATSSTKHCHYADQVIALDEQGNIRQQGLPSAIEDLDNGPTSNELSQKLDNPELDESVAELSMQEDSEDPESSRSTGDLKIYSYYAGVIGWKSLAPYLFLSVAFVLAESFSSVWLQWWSNSNTNSPSANLGYWLGIYGGIAAVAVVCGFASESVFQLIIIPITADKFHNSLLETIKCATTSFLVTTDIGDLMNRFSQDLELIDSELPGALDMTIIQALTTIAEAVFLFIGSKYLAVGIPVCVGLIYVIQFVYLRTSRQLRLLDIEAKAPLVSHFLETIHGATSIRAYGWLDDYACKSRKLLDDSQAPYYLMLCIQRWLTLVLDLLVAGIAIVLVATALEARTPYLGIALYSLVSFSMTLQELVSEWTQLETGIGALSRVRNFVRSTPMEDGNGDEAEESTVQPLPPSWPAHGAIEITDVTASHNRVDDPVLKQVSFSVQAGQKIAICGRTGSGKSSLLSALLQMMHVTSGQITIDGIDTSRISKEELRKRINAIPQDWFCFPGTVHENLDPWRLWGDDRILCVLKRLNLHEWLDTCGGLEEELDDTSLSHGQKQMFSLARAILKPSQIVVMDEATSSVASDSEKLMSQLIKEEFSGRTIIATSHKLDAVLDFDCVILMDNGHIAETGNPRELLTIPDSLFRRQYESG